MARNKVRSEVELTKRIDVPCHQATKAAFREVARLRRATQAELGLAAVTFALSNPAGLDLALAMLRRSQTGDRAA